MPTYYAVVRLKPQHPNSNRNPDLDFLNWKLAQCYSCSVHTNFVFFLSLFALELKARAGQTDRRTDSKES